MVNINELEIKIYPLILDSDPAAAFWHLIKTLDMKASGKISFTMKELIEITNYSRATIYRYMHSELFIKVVKHKNKHGIKVYTFYYKSLKRVATSLEVENQITSSFCYWKDIQHFYTKRVTATEVIAASQQNKSRYCARNKKDKSQRLIQLNKIFSEGSNSSISDNTQGIKRHNNLIYFNKKDYAPYGTSQSSIANTLKRNIRTVNQRLKNTRKVKQFIAAPQFTREAQQTLFFDKEEWTNNYGAKYTTYNDTVYLKYTNLYNCEYHLKFKKLSYSNPSPTV